MLSKEEDAAVRAEIRKHAVKAVVTRFGLSEDASIVPMFEPDVTVVQLTHLPSGERYGVKIQIVRVS